MSTAAPWQSKAPSGWQSEACGENKVQEMQGNVASEDGGGWNSLEGTSSLLFENRLEKLLGQC
jgi:hypothetical protein